MPVEVHERHQSRKAGQDWREYAYIVIGTDSELAALNAAPGQQYIEIPHPLGENYPSLRLTKSVTVEQVIDGPDPGRHTWEAVVRYENSSSGGDDGGEANFYSISVSAHTANVKVALEQEKHLATGETDPGDFANWIGVVRSGAAFDVQGVDCLFPQATLEIERQYSRSVWNAKVKQIIGKVGMVNSDSFEGFSAEEVLFAGARVSRGTRAIHVAYQFMISPTEDVTIPGIGAVPKRGWRYVWVYSRPAANGIGTRAVAAYVARVYRTTSFGNIL